MREAAAALPRLSPRPTTSPSSSTRPANLPHVLGDRDELIQLFQNLIHNAIKYGRDQGHVWISLKQVPGAGRRGAEAMIQACVKDDGEGIPQEAIPRLTERFYRVDVKRSRERGGTGLGLAIVKHIVNRHRRQAGHRKPRRRRLHIYDHSAGRCRKAAPRSCHGSAIKPSHSHVGLSL